MLSLLLPLLGTSALSPDVCFCDWDQVGPGEDCKRSATVLELRVMASVENCEGISDAAVVQVLDRGLKLLASVEGLVSGEAGCVVEL